MSTTTHRPRFGRDVTQCDGYLTVQIREEASYHNIAFASKLTDDDLQTLTRLITDEVRQAYGQGYHAAQDECINTFCGDYENPNWFDKLPENPAWVNDGGD